ncbi:MAG: hypothetical protein AAGJ81_14740 [Verrucomicrobiota bacterium]
MATWTLTIDGASKTLAAWGLKAVLILRSRGQDELNLTGKTADAASPPMQGGEAVALFKDGARVFAGECVPAECEASGRTEGFNLSVMGPLHFLRTHIYEQKVLDLQADPVAPVDPVEWTTEVTLFQDESATRSTTLDQLRDAIAQTTRFQEGNFALSAVDPVSETADSIFLSDVIRRCLRWHPQSVSWFDYSGGGVPSLNIQQSGLPTLSLPFDQNGGFKVKPRPDLHFTGVVIRYRNAFRAGEAPVNVTDSAGSSTSGENTLVLTYDLGGNTVEPSGLAAVLYAGFSSLPYEFIYALNEEECSPGIHLGKAGNITGGNAAWASMNSPIQEAVYDIHAGTTVLQGAPLPTQELNDLIELLRLKTYPNAPDGGRASTQEPFQPESPGAPWTSYKISPTSFKISPGYIGAASLSNPDSTYSGNGECWIRVDVDDDGGATSCSVSSGGSPPSPSASTAIIPLNTFFTEDGEVNVNDGLSGNKAFFSIGVSNGHLWI